MGLLNGTQVMVTRKYDQQFLSWPHVTKRGKENVGALSTASSALRTPLLKGTDITP